MFKYFKKLINAWFIKKPKKTVVKKQKSPGILGIDWLTERTNAFLNSFRREAVQDIVRPIGAMDGKSVSTMDESIETAKLIYSGLQNTVPNSLLNWYGAQGFIGYQVAAVIAQHWLVYKCCNMPARDAIRKGYEITVNDGTEIGQEVLDAMRKADIRYRVMQNMEQFVTMGRVFGIRILMFKMDLDNIDEYYEKPFNIDGVKPGSYKGIVQVDPYWITPELDMDAGANPESMFFYEPTWWRVNGKRIHRTHLIIFKNGEVADILKPTYLYGGVPVPQRIYERVYCAERTANEAPQLAMTKRTTAIHVDLSQALANQGQFEERIQQWATFRDNYGVKILGQEETAEQFDTSLADLDAVIMTQYQIVAAAANVPATKLLGTTPKGFNASGAYEEKSYHEELESIQANDLTQLLERHHMILIRSEICPQFDLAPFATTVSWEPVATVNDVELATLNKAKADTGQVLIMSGAIDAEDERKRIMNDPNSGYSGMHDEEVESLAGGDPQQDPEADPDIAAELEQFTQTDLPHPYA